MTCFCYKIKKKFYLSNKRVHCQFMSFVSYFMTFYHKVFYILFLLLTIMIRIDYFIDKILFNLLINLFLTTPVMIKTINASILYSRIDYVLKLLNRVYIKATNIYTRQHLILLMSF